MGCSARSRSPSLASRGFARDGAVKGGARHSKRYGATVVLIGLTENSVTVRNRSAFLYIIFRTATGQCGEARRKLSIEFYAV